MTCVECERLKDELAKVRAENNRLGDELIKFANKLLMVRRVLDEITGSETINENY